MNICVLMLADQAKYALAYHAQRKTRKAEQQWHWHRFERERRAIKKLI